MSIRVWTTKAGVKRYSPAAWSVGEGKPVHLGTFDTREEAEEAERLHRLQQVEQRRAELLDGKSVAVGGLGHCGAKSATGGPAEIRVVLDVTPELRTLLERLLGAGS